MQDAIKKLEAEISEKISQLAFLRKEAPLLPVKNYTFKDGTGDVSLLELFGDKKQLFMIHNMGQGCRYCTLWADGLNGYVPHLESKYALALVSKDPPELQRTFANSRGWRFRMASHGGGEYIKEQTVYSGEDNAPGIVCYERQSDKIVRRSGSQFGPGDLYAPIWHILSLAGEGETTFTPQYNYWKTPAKMDDGGQNLL